MEATFLEDGEMNSLEFEEMTVSLAIVFLTPLSMVPRLKERILNALEELPEVKAIYQRISPGRLRVEVEGVEH